MLHTPQHHAAFDPEDVRSLLAGKIREDPSRIGDWFRGREWLGRYLLPSDVAPMLRDPSARTRTCRRALLGQTGSNIVLTGARAPGSSRFAHLGVS